MRTILYRQFFKEKGLFLALNDPYFSKAIGLTDENLEKFNSKMGLLQKEYDEFLAQLKEKAIKQVEDSLDANQKAELSKLLGGKEIKDVVDPNDKTFISQLIRYSASICCGDELPGNEPPKGESVLERPASAK